MVIVQILSLPLGICEFETVIVVPLWAWTEWKVSASSKLQKGFPMQPVQLREWELAFLCLLLLVC